MKWFFEGLFDGITIFGAAIIGMFVVALPLILMVTVSPFFVLIYVIFFLFYKE